VTRFRSHRVPTSVAARLLPSRATVSASDQSAFRFWFERRPPERYARLLEGAAVIVGDNAGSGPDGIAKAQAVVASARVRYDAELMDRAPGLRVISRTGIGVDNIELDQATMRGIAVCNVPGGPTVSTAEHTVTLLMAAAKQIPAAAQALREGRGDFFNDYQGLELDGLTLGLVGLGQIGRRVALICSSIGMSVIAFDPYVDPVVAEAIPTELVGDLETLLRRADAVSLHTPLTDQTARMIDRDRLALMKPGSILVNTARGGLVDEAALVEALAAGHLSAAGLDVFDPEPPRSDNPLLHRLDVIATPHVAGATLASKDRLWRIAITQALQVLRGETPANLVNPATKPR
jgi:D-3-phosphoglycerate dehydrogenase / 2-oxoglutarate reductase